LAQEEDCTGRAGRHCRASHCRLQAAPFQADTGVVFLHFIRFLLPFSPPSLRDYVARPLRFRRFSPSSVSRFFHYAITDIFSTLAD